MTTVAKGFCTSAPVPVAKAIGTKPNEATSAVMITGRNRVRAPWLIAARAPTPSAISFRIWLSITNPFRTATPERAMKPTAAEIENGMPRSQSAAIPPVRARGTALKTRSASRADPSALNNRRKIRRKQPGTTSIRRWRATEKFSNCPPQLRKLPGASLTCSFTLAWASATSEPISRPRTSAVATTRRLPFSRLIWFAPSVCSNEAIHDLESAIPLEDEAGGAAADRGFDQILDRCEAEAPPADLGLVYADFKERQSGGLLDFDALGAVDFPQYVGNPARGPLHLREIIAEHLHGEVFAHAGDQFVEAHFDRLRKADLVTRQLGGLRLDPLDEVVLRHAGVRPFVLRLDDDVGIGGIGGHRVRGEIGGTGP